MQKLSAYLFIFLAIAVHSNGQFRFVLEGTIGNYPVVMKIDNDNINSEMVSNVTYFYKKYRHDISLEGDGQQFPVLNSLSFKREGYDSKTSKEITLERFVIKRSGEPISNAWKGKWYDQKGNELPVSLKPIDTSKYNFLQTPDLSFENDADRIYTKARLSGISFITDSITRKGKFEIEWLHEPETKVVAIKIKSGYPAIQLTKINEALKKEFLSTLNAYLRCTVGSGDKGEYDFWINNIYISDKYLSVQAHLNIYCGGAHPSAGDASFTVDAKTGKKITDIDELFWFTGKKPLQEKEKGYYDYIDVRTKTIVALLKELYPVQMKKPTSEDDCDYSNGEHWNFPSWYLTEKGLYLGASFPHARASCDSPDFSIIPYAVLEKYKAKNKE